jgi:hypothetical protein
VRLLLLLLLVVRVAAGECARGRTAATQLLLLAAVRVRSSILAVSSVWFSKVAWLAAWNFEHPVSCAGCRRWHGRAVTRVSDL